MNNAILKLMKIYIELAPNARLDFLNELGKLEMMSRAVKKDYENTLRSIPLASITSE